MSIGNYKFLHYYYDFLLLYLIFIIIIIIIKHRKSENTANVKLHSLLPNETCSLYQATPTRHTPFPYVILIYA